MTQTRTPLARQIRTAAPYVALVLAALFLLGVLCWIAVDNTVRNAPEVQEQAAVVQMHRIDAIPAYQPLSEREEFLTGLLGEGADYTEAQGARLAEAGHLVCDGFTDGVPVATMTSVLMAQYRLTGDEAMTLVNTAGTTLCV